MNCQAPRGLAPPVLSSPLLSSLGVPRSAHAIPIYLPAYRLPAKINSGALALSFISASALCTITRNPSEKKKCKCKSSRVDPWFPALETVASTQPTTPARLTSVQRA